MRHLFLKLAISGIAVLTPAWAMCSDQDTANQIAANLKNSGKLKGYEINVRVQDGTAQLDGHVRDARQLQYAMAIAGQTAGIEEVINGLTVKPDGRSQKLPVARPVQRASAEEIPNDELILGSPAASPMSPTMTELAARRCRLHSQMHRSVAQPQLHGCAATTTGRCRCIFRVAALRCQWMPP